MDEALRNAVFKRDGYTCQAHPNDYSLDMLCSGRLHAHHRVLRSQGGRDCLEHLVTLCALHHDYVHNVDRAGAEVAGLIVRLA